ncbi:MAG: aromatic ring-hydroxylating dioxygenase subunit alpha [Pseudomonadota bacterium]
MNDINLSRTLLQGEQPTSQFGETHLEGMRRDLAVTAAAAEYGTDAVPYGLAGRFYTDPTFFDHERRTLLRRGWHCVGRADEVLEKGDYFTLTLLGEPLIVVRDGGVGGGQVRALSNVCRHRGMPVAKGSGRKQQFVCSYHAWAYGTDGSLLRAPRMDHPKFDKEACRLGEFACAERFGFIYVCLAGSPPNLDAHLNGLEDLIGPYDTSAYRIVHSATEVWKTNWKCLVENFMEGYHLSMVHPQTLHGYTPTSLCKKAASGEGFTSYFAHYPPGIPSRGHGAPGLDETARSRSTLFSVFPCHVVSLAASLMVSLSILPLTVDTIDVRWTVSVYGDDLDDATIAERVALWEAVNREDRLKLEAMQAGLGSIHATGGPLAGDDYEGTVRDFLLWLARIDGTATPEAQSPTA